MFLMTLFSTVYLLVGPAALNPSMEIIRQQRLETIEGRDAFLTDKLAPYAREAGRINCEIQTLSAEIEALSFEDQPQIVALTQEVTEKMDQLLAMMPALDLASSIDDDFQQIEVILNQTDPLSPEQQEAIDRVASLCKFVESDSF